VKIGIVGGGVVGRAIARCSLEHVDEVRVSDDLPERSTHNLIVTLASDIIFICVPEDRVEDCFEEMLMHKTEVHRQRNFVLKSTVPIGTTRRLTEKYSLPNLVHSPEFLTSRCAMTDAQMPARNIIGVPFPHRSADDWKLFTGNNRAAQELGILYATRFPGVVAHLMSSDESEAVKLFTNGFFAVKIAYFNEIRALADKLGLRWDKVLAGMLSDGRIAHSHTQVPGPDGKFGFGGKCLPKDLETLIIQLDGVDSSGAQAAVCRAVLYRNEKIDRKDP
jgi:UDPglucose 6-dehydrogenase